MSDAEHLCAQINSGQHSDETHEIVYGPEGPVRVTERSTGRTARIVVLMSKTGPIAVPAE